MSEENRKESLEKIIRAILGGEAADITAPPEASPDMPAPPNPEAVIASGRDRDRARALEICRCFALLAPPTERTEDFPSDSLSRSEDLEPLAAAIREGRMDLLELAFSARKCSEAPETDDVKSMQAAAEWAAYLLAKGHAYLLHGGPDEPRIDAEDWSKGDVLRFLEKTLPEAFKAFPPESNKHARAAFWASVGAKFEQGYGGEITAFKETMKEIEKDRGKP